MPAQGRRRATKAEYRCACVSKPPPRAAAPLAIANTRAESTTAAPNDCRHTRTSRTECARAHTRTHVRPRPKCLIYARARTHTHGQPAQPRAPRALQRCTAAFPASDSTAVPPPVRQPRQLTTAHAREKPHTRTVIAVVVAVEGRSKRACRRAGPIRIGDSALQYITRVFRSLLRSLTLQRRRPRPCCRCAAGSVRVARPQTRRRHTPASRAGMSCAQRPAVTRHCTACRRPFE